VVSAADASSAVVQLEGERRTATVILADVQGSTPLLEQIGTEAWVSMMNRVFHILETEIYRYGGEVDQFRGDGLVAFFGATSAHEDDPERAILAALAMQSALEPYSAELASGRGTWPERPTLGRLDGSERAAGAEIDLRLRVGINTGEVIVANIGDSRRHSEDTAMGEAIALADRMEKAAEPGTVLVSENTYQLTQARFEWQALGEISVKGVSRPVAVYRPLRPRRGAARSLRLETYGLSSLLIGRDREFSSLTSCVQAVRDGRGGVVLLTGSEGMGKSHLVATVRQHVARDEALLAEADKAFRPLAWLWGQSHSYEQTWPYSMWLDMGRRWLGVREAEPSVELRERLREQCEVLWGEQMAEYYPYLARMLSLPLEEPFAQWVDGLGAEALRQSFFLTVSSWVEALARNGPVVLVFEDVHWADVASLELLEHCLPLCDRAGVLWVIMTRATSDGGVLAADDASPAWNLSQRLEAAYPQRLVSLSLPPLTEDQSSEMIDRMIGPDALPAETRALLIEKAEGNPYYIEELIRSLIRAGILVQDGETCQWRVSPDTRLAGSHPASLDLPDTLRSLLLARMDDLAPEERRVLQVAAVIGAVFWENVLSELVGQESNVKECLVALQGAQFVRQVGRVPHLGVEYHFQSSLIRDAAYEGILSAQRVRYHQQVAEHLARPSGDGILAQYYGLVAYHFRCARERRRELFYTLSAAEHAQEIYANAEALEYYTRALRLLDELSQEEVVSLGRLWHDWRLETLRGLGQVYYGTGRVTEAEGNFREAIALAKEMGADEEHPLAVTERVRLYYWLGETLHWQHRHEEQIEIAQEGLALLAQEAALTEAALTEAPESVETALMNQEIAVGYLSLGDNARFQEYTQRTASFLEHLPYSEELRPAYDHVAIMYAYDRKDLAEAKRWLDALEGFATLYHDLRALGDAHYSAAGILDHSGDSYGAITRLRKALEIFDRIGDTKQKVWCLSRLVEIFLSLGDLLAAEECTRAELDAAEKAKARGAMAYAYWHLGQVRICEGAWEEAVEAVQEAVGLFHGAEDRWDEGGAVYSLGRILLAQGDRDGALVRYQEAMDQVDLEVLSQNTLSLAFVLSAAEEAYQEPEAFYALCARWRAKYPQLAGSPLQQWYLEPAEVESAAFDRLRAYEDRFVDLLGPSWHWEDPLDDCWFRIQQGLEVHASNRRGLWHINLSAPRVLRPVLGDLAVQTACSCVTDEAADDVPASGGLLMWADAENYLRLDVGTGGGREVLFGGCIRNVDLVAGRGRLPQAASGGQATSEDRSEGPTAPILTGKVHLRLERIGEDVRALCSLDGAEWFSVGQVAFPVADPLRLGLYANGNIDRLIYPGAYPDGTAIRFEAFQMWGGG
jgi:predicted ATPase/class 3 adenylate cyclase